MSEVEGPLKGIIEQVKGVRVSTDKDFVVRNVKTSVDGLVLGDGTESNNISKLAELKNQISILETMISELEGDEKGLDSVLSNLNKLPSLFLEKYSENLLKLSNFDYNTRIQKLGLSIRVFNRLESGEIYTLGKLLTCFESELFKIESFGKGSLIEVKERLKKYNLSLGISEETLIKNGYKPENNKRL